MLQSWIDGTITFCIRFFRTVILAGLILASASAVYAARHFAIDTDINDLISAKLPWRQHEIDFQRAFPQTVELIIADVHAPTPEAVKAAARELQKALADKPGLFHSTIDQFDSPFFRRSGLLYLPPDRIEQFTEPLAKAKPLVAGLVTDPSLRGLLRVLGQLLLSTQQDLLPFDDLQRPLNTAAATLEDVAKGQPAEFSWRVLSQGDPKPLELHRFVQIRPVLDHDALEPGGRATSAIRDIVNQSGIEQKFGADVSLTGPTIISDNEFSGVHEGIVLNSVVTGAIVLVILWLALRSLRLVAAAVVTLAVGLLVTSAGGILIVGALNPISLAFAVLFVGLGADFAIQYTVRYRAERHEKNDLARSLIGSADWVGIPLTLAAGAAAAGFLSFTPTAYIGLAQLGIIAGFGMLVAYATSLTLLPALIRAVDPPRRTEAAQLAILGARGRVPDSPSDCGDCHHRRNRRRRTAVAVVVEIQFRSAGAGTADVSRPGFALPAGQGNTVEHGEGLGAAR